MSSWKIKWVKFDGWRAYIKFYKEGTDEEHIAEFSGHDLFEMMQNGEITIVTEAVEEDKNNE